MRRIAVGLLIGGVVGCATAAQAQTVYGPGGLFVHPSAFTPARGTFNMNASYFQQREAGEGRVEWQPTSFTYSPADQMQVGATLVRRHTEIGHDDSGGIFAKYRLRAATKEQPTTVSLVGSYLAPGIKQSSLSAVASQIFKEGIVGHFGIQWVRSGDQDGTAAFVGAQAPLSPSVSVLAEYGTRFRFNAKAATSLGVVWMGRGQSLGVGYVNPGGSQNSQFFIGAGYPLGGVK